MYKEVFFKSWKGLFNNLYLIIPDLLYLAFMTGLGLVLAWFGGFWGVFDYFLGGVTPSTESVLNFLEINWIKLLISAIIFFISSFMVGASIVAFKYILMKNIVMGNKFSFIRVYKTVGGYFWNVVLLRFMIFLIMIPVFVLWGLMFYLGFENQGYLLKILGLIVMILSMVLVKWVFLFVYPVMFLKSNNAYKSLKGSFAFFKNHFKIVLFSWLILVFAAGVFSAIVSLLSSFIVGIILVFAIRSTLNVFIKVWGELFLFYIYDLKS